MNKKWIKSLTLSCLATITAAVISTTAAASSANEPNGYNTIADVACAQVSGQWYICCDDAGNCTDATYT